MSDLLAQDMQIMVQSLAAQGRNELQRHLLGAGQSAGRRAVVLRALGAVSIGILAAGIAVFLIVVVLNLVFHYVPT